MLSPDESLNESHRHYAHAMSIYPLELLNYDRSERDRKIIDKTIENLEVLGSGFWVGFSFPWMAQFYACQGNGEGAAYQLKLFWESFCSQNGFNLNGDYKKHGLSYYHYRPFTLEANMAAADAVQEMLLQTRDGIIRLFPAVPKNWFESCISFDKLRAPGGILVSANSDKTGFKKLVLKCEHDCTVKIINIFNSNRINIENQDNIKQLNCSIGKLFEVKLKAGMACVITG